MTVSNDRAQEASATFDVIVCGAGSSGSTLAGRLAEDPSLSVLLLEAGPDDDRDNVRNPALWPTNLGTDATWNFAAQPSAELGGRAIPYFMGRGLGGGSSVNVTVWSRGHRADWNSYADLTGDDAWDYQHVLALYQQIETYHGAPDPRRGAAGPMWIEQMPDDHPMRDAIEHAANEAGFASVASLNGALMEGREGTARRDADVHDGQRQSPYRSYVYPKRDQQNLTVLTGAEVAEVLFDGKRASGVRLTDGRTFRASEQVVLSLGAVNTPMVLLRSGIGDHAQLQRLGLPVRQDLPGVGSNLHDHILVPLIWEAAPDADLAPPRLATNGVYWNLDDPEQRAVVLYVDPSVSPSQTTAQRQQLPERGVTFLTGVRLRSRGRITLDSAAPGTQPVIDHGYFTDPDDMAAVIAIVKKVTTIGDAKSLRPYVSRRVLPAADATDAELTAYIREATQTFWHQSGTAAMGSGEHAVVDSRLRVHGLEGLRVADASVLPHVTVGNTMAPSVVIGEQAAAFVRDDLEVSRQRS